MDFGNLIKALEAEAEIYKKFAEVEDEKTAVIIEGDIEKLDGILNVEQELHMKAQNIERIRVAAIKSLGLDGSKTLIDVIALSNGAQKEKLSKLFDDLNAYITSIKQINEYNTKLVKSRLEIISAVNNLYIDPNAPRTGSPSSGDTAIYGKDAKVLQQPADYERAVVRKKL